MRIGRVLLSLLLGSVTAFALVTPAQAAPLAENYVALGDSYASGTGAGSYGDSGSCLRSANAYAPLWASSHGAAFTFAACSGADTGDVLNGQLGALSAATTLVTISIGGNDIGFADIVTTCTFGSNSTCVNRVNEARAQAQSVLPGRLDAVYTAIRDRAPAARVIVLGYPRLFTAGSCFWFSTTKRNALNTAANELSDVIAGRAGAAGFTYEDARDNFAGHEVCTSSPWINGINLGNIVESYHPNAAGHRNGYLAALNGVTG
ncbi:SGNH/GDSL hydrolase family protein [Actinophytocola sp.]|uniref:SGNH/GDSL hydrolase family protein n=1 Tax=Actinophytocola sp. TaxID=1872138 RepID=UPI002D801F82|nr:SGNH/GDSL hydrolase family protein [Actinophytocola sp.]HET9143842.1 SGNH/GDSL hydrolase family protein [Actinophytocola sp.]